MRRPVVYGIIFALVLALGLLVVALYTGIQDANRAGYATSQAIMNSAATEFYLDLTLTPS